MDARKIAVAKQRLLIYVVLCAVLPPVGMLLVWRGRYPRRGKLALSLFASIILTLMFSFALSLRAPVDIEPTPMSANYGVTAPTAAPVSPSTDDLIAPANPNG